MDASVAGGLFALGGVVIGGLINGLATWVHERRSRTAAGRVASMLVAEELMESSSTLLQLREEPKWGVLQTKYFGRDECWLAHRGTLAQVLPTDGYIALSAAYHGLRSAVETAESEAPQARLDDASLEALQSTYSALSRGLAFLTPHVFAHRFSQLLERRRARREARRRNERLLRQDPAYQAFIADFDADAGPTDAPPRS